MGKMSIVTNEFKDCVDGGVFEDVDNDNAYLKFLNKFINLIKFEMVKKEYTITSLARACDMHPASMSRVLSGRLNITISTMYRIMNVLGIEMDFAQ
jgi:DNA-binding phage protein